MVYGFFGSWKLVENCLAVSVVEFFVHIFYIRVNSFVHILLTSVTCGQENQSEQE